MRLFCCSGMALSEQRDVSLFCAVFAEIWPHSLGCVDDFYSFVFMSGLWLLKYIRCLKT